MNRQRAIDVFYAGILAYVVIACSGPGKELLSDAMTKAGEALVDAGIDAGKALVDAGKALDAGERDAAPSGDASQKGDGALSEASAQSDASTPAPGYSPMTSGSRLTALQESWVGEDGSKYTPPSYLFHDNKLDIDCQPGYDENGDYRCLPKPQISTMNWYEDSSCTIGPVGIDVNNCDSKYAYSGTSLQNCSYNGYKIYKIGNKLTTLYQKTNTSDGGFTCSLIQSNTGYTLYHLTAVDPSIFVKFTAK